MGLVALRHMESSWIRDGAGVPCIARQIPNHWRLPGKPLSKLFISLAALGLSCLMWDLSLLGMDSLIAGLFALWYVGS